MQEDRQTGNGTAAYIDTLSEARKSAVRTTGAGNIFPDFCGLMWKTRWSSTRHGFAEYG